MKPHLTMSLRAGARHRPLRPWHDVSLAATDDHGLRPDVDAVIRRHRRAVWFTQEYEQAGEEWNPDERHLGLDRIVRVVSQTDQPFGRDLIAELATLPSVNRVDAMSIAGAPLPPTTGHGRPSRWAGEMVGLPEAHLRTRGAPAVTVAVLDTGVNPHPELALSPGRDFVDIIPGSDTFVGDSLDADRVAEDPGVGHGTHVSGIIAARGLAMPVGVAPRCRIVPVRVLGALERDGRLIGAGVVDNIDSGIKWAVDNGAAVINMSLGIRRTGGGPPHARVIAYARRRGVVVTAASGNDGTDALYYPGSLPGVLAVGAVDSDGSVPGFSTWGRQVSLVAPGVDIYSSLLDGTYGLASGTSQAAPFVAGAAALLLSRAAERGTRLTPDGVTRVLTATANRPGTTWRDRHYGAGVVDVGDALRLLDLECDQISDRPVTHPAA
ncbi:S8 family serine peptidase [Ornithinimicrobium sufpigmenti]|uniref:S8 family serine peptidase n=1 Tax=Ornithinimicrobium sufpigmenti TaxID=2508882 RepID=UPI001643FA4C|nr:S8 family serine peptidase [Ornithinimicrobium sp. HY006]